METLRRQPSTSRTLRVSPLAIADAYKESHHKQYPEGTTWVYSNLTPRTDRLANGVEEFVFFGLQAFLYQLNDQFEKNFFSLPKDEAVREFAEFYERFFGSPDHKLYERIAELHDIQHLPLLIKALPEGTPVKHGIPVLTIENTHPDFFWLTNFVETWLSAALWHPCTSASTAFAYRKTFDAYAKQSSDQDFMPAFQGHDFSMRGLPGVEAANASAAGHCLSFQGSDVCTVLNYVDRYYWGENGLIATSVPATEHSVMCAGGQETELETYRRLLNIYPTGILSVVSDTWDFWKVVTEILPQLKNEIMARDGKLVVRPDSGDPVLIICGDPEAEPGSPENLGLIKCLSQTFGATTNSKGYLELDSHIGAIYGDSITKDRQEQILHRLTEDKFASTNVVLGIGSYTYQYVTRDTHGIAVKATAVGHGWDWELNRPATVIPIFKDPKTDNSGKKSAKGLLSVVKNEGVPPTYRLLQECDISHDDDCLRPVYENGIVTHQSFAEIRSNLEAHK